MYCFFSISGLFQLILLKLYVEGRCRVLSNHFIFHIDQRIMSESLKVYNNNNNNNNNTDQYFEHERYRVRSKQCDWAQSDVRSIRRVGEAPVRHQVCWNNAQNSVPTELKIWGLNYEKEMVNAVNFENPTKSVRTYAHCVSRLPNFFLYITALGILA